MTLKSAMVVAIGALVATSAFAEGAPKGDAAKGQQTATTVCAGCHGADGNSMVPTFPSLAGQHPEYIVSQIKAFKDSSRKDPTMQPMAMILATPEDMANIAAFYGAQKPNGNKPRDEKLLPQGKKLYQGGNTQSGVAACAACHNPSGAGVPAQFPRLAGQHPDYVIKQLKAFKSGERANDPGKMMQGVAVKMTDQEITAVAEYIASLK